ncbi:MAG: c-type cytochrome [Planctomycetota bacterium]
MRFDSMPISLATGLWDRMWFRSNGNEYSDAYNAIYYFIFWISAFFFIVLMSLTVVFMLKYKRKQGVPAEVSASHNTALEITWSVIPAIGFAVMFFWGTWAYLPKTVVPDGAETINVTAQQWVWSFEYPNGASPLQTEIVSDKNLALFAIPAGRPVKFLMSSSDVIHSFYIPEFRVKRDVFPNRYTVAWVEADVVTHYFDPDSGLALPYDRNNDGKITDGEQGFYLYCTEYCGDQHSQMTHRIAVLDEADYQAWLDQQANTDSIPLLELGQTLYSSKGCNACHSVQENGMGTGPSWYGVYGEARPGYTPMNRDENPEAVVDYQYIRESILNPAAYYVPGYEGVNMPSYAGQLSDREIRALAVYFKALSGKAPLIQEAEEESAEEAREREEGGDAAEEGADVASAPDA